MIKLLRNSPKLIKKRWLLSVLGLFTTIFISSTAVKTRAVNFIGDFETGDFSGWRQELCCQHSAQVVSSPTRSGEYAARFTLYKEDALAANSRRAELKLDPVPANSEQWYALSIFVPQEYASDPSYDIITQWAGRPDFNLGEDWRQPIIALSIRDNRFRLSNRWDSKTITTNETRSGEVGWDLGAVVKEQWVDWVFHVKWSYGSDGLLEVWKNGKLVVKKVGPNTYNDLTGPYIKVGIYKPQWKVKPELSRTTKRVIYLDEVRVGDAGASYDDVVPRSRFN